MLRTDFINPSIRFFLITLNLVNKVDNIFITAELTIENSRQGLINNTKFRTFHPSINSMENSDLIGLLKTGKIIFSVIHTLMITKLLMSHPNAAGGFYPRYVFTL